MAAHAASGRDEARIAKELVALQRTNARLNWRSDVAPFFVLVHSRRYANDRALPAIRRLNIAGAFGVLSPLAILAHKLFVDLSSSTP